MKATLLETLETALATALYESTDSVCSIARCDKWPHVASKVAERIVDTISWEWGGQQIYLTTSSPAGRKSEIALTTEEFFMEVQGYILDELKKYASLQACADCSQTQQDHMILAESMLGELYSALVGELFYIPFDNTRRNKRLLREYDGSNIYRLARKYRIGVPLAYSLVRKQQEILPCSNSI